MSWPTPHFPHKDADRLPFFAQTSAVFIFTSPPGVSLAEGPQYEQLIDAKYLDASNAASAWRLESYRAPGNVNASNVTVAQELRCYFLSKCNFPESTGPVDPKAPVDIRAVADKTFLEKATPNTLQIYQDIMQEALQRCALLFHCSHGRNLGADGALRRRMGPVVTAYEVEGSRERRVVIGYKAGGTKSFFSALSDLYREHSSMLFQAPS